MKFFVQSALAFILLGGLFFGGTFGAQAQVVHQEFQEMVRAEVLEITESYDRDIMGTNTTTTVQVLRIELLEGDQVGVVKTLENDLTLLSVGDTIFVNRLESIDGTEYITFKDVERRPQLLIVTLLLVGLVVVFAGWQGVRAIGSLLLSIAAIIMVLVPALLAGYPPALVSLGIAAVILSITLFFTHGFRPHVVIAYIGTMSAVAVTCLLAWWSVDFLRLSGFSSDASVYLNFSTGGTLDIAGLLLGSIIIGLLGVLDDVSITQASVVQELRRANSALPWQQLYLRATRVGRDHVGSLVNTLALAYVGAALPLVLLYAQSDASWLISLNQEVIAAEILRIVVGSIGLILAVPLTTMAAAWYFKDKEAGLSDGAETSHSHHHH